jgi:2-dehydro-3-deoxyphosphooctonate aldolase (KDO 8-P synthase)
VGRECSSPAVQIGSLFCGGGKPFILIAGPCVVESRESALRHADALQALTMRLGIPFIYKSSYDKANRTAIDSFRG